MLDDICDSMVRDEGVRLSAQLDSFWELLEVLG